MRGARGKTIEWTGVAVWAALAVLAVGFGVTGDGTAATSAPYLVGCTPGPGETMPVGAAFELIFDRAMEPRSVETAFSTDPCVAGMYSWANARTLRFEPLAPLEPGAVYTVSVSTHAMDSMGVPLSEEIRFRVTTAGFLEVSQTIPEAGSADIPTDATITVVFSRPVVPLVTPSDPRFSDLPQPLLVEPAIEGTGEWINTSIFVFTPTARLAGGTTYSARIPAGLTDVGGAVLEEEHAWEFSTARPTVVSVSPRDDADHVPVDASIRVEFDMPIDSAGVGDRLTLRKASLLGELLPQYVPGTVHVDGRVVTFTPEEWLAFDARYVVGLEEGVVSVGGGMGSDEAVVLRFETVPLPRVTGTRPVDGDRDAPPYTDFSIVFNTAIDPDTVLENITMEPALPEDVRGWFDGWSRRYSFDFGAAPSGEYTVYIGPGIKDRFGNATGQTLEVSFRTAPLEPAAWLQLPGLVGTHGSDAPARVIAAHRNTPRLDLELYRLSLEEFFEAQRQWYDYEPARSTRIRQWSVPVESPQDELAYTPVDLLENRATLEPGIYLLLLEARGVDYGWYRPHHVLVVSPRNITLKRDEKRAMAWVTDLSTGAPVSGVKLAAYTWKGEEVDGAVTDPSGIAEFTDPEVALTSDLVVVAREPFALASSGWSGGIQSWDYGYNTSSLTSMRTHLETDRPIYRPGQRIHFRGVIRSEDDARYRLPDTVEVDVSIRNARWELVYEETLPVDDFGSFVGELVLSDDAALGDYVLAVSAPGSGTRHTFTVAAYRPPEFSVSVTLDREQLAAGESAEARVDVVYFFGGPVADADVEWTVFAEPFTFDPSGFERYRFRDTDDPWSCWSCWWWGTPTGPEVIASGHGRTDASGHVVVALTEELTDGAVRDDEGVLRGSQTLIVEATAYGADGQVLSGRSRVTVHQGAFYVGLAPDRAIGAAGTEMRTDVVAVDWEGRRRAGEELSFSVIRREWVNSLVDLETGGSSWKWTTVDTEVDSGRVMSDELGEAAVSFVPPEGGLYRVSVEGMDARERQVRSSDFVWVSGPGSVSWRRENHDRITLVADKGSYEVGDIARVLIPSPYEGEHWAWITVERGTLLQQEVVLLTSNSTVYELAIAEDHIPNVYVSAVLVQGREAALAQDGIAVASHRVGYAAVSVDAAPRRLGIDLSTSSIDPQPGEDVTYTLQVVDPSGNPVRSAVAIDVVDKAVLSLSPREPDAIATTYYSPRGLGVRTSSGLAVSVERLLEEQMQNLDVRAVDDLMSFEAPGSAGPVVMMAMEEAGRAPTVGDEAPAGAEVREEFADTAFWDGRVVTDSDGHAAFTVRLPDNLTTWAVRAVAVTRDTLVGEATEELLVTKPLLVRPVAPRFFVVDDRVQLDALVNNNTEVELDVEVRLQADGLTLDGEPAQRVLVPAGGEGQVSWWAIVDDVPAVDLIVRAAAGDLHDAARPRLTTGPDGTLRVYRYVAPEVVGTAGVLAEAGYRTERILLPPSADPLQGQLTVRLDPSLAAAMREGLDYLEHFEYECTEQLVSRFLPNVLNYRAMTLLGVAQPEARERLAELVDAALSKLYARQHADGGWGWWSGSRSDRFLTAYVVWAMQEASNLGFSVRSTALDAATDYVVAELLSADELDAPYAANAQAWMLYVLAIAEREGAVSEHAAALYDARAHLAHYARALLVLALHRMDATDARLSTLLSEIQNGAILSATGAHWEEASYSGWAMNTDTRSTAIILDALVAVEPEAALLPNVVRWLMTARRAGIWETTQETAWALIALTDWMVATGELDADYAYVVDADGTELAAGRMAPETAEGTVIAELRLASWADPTSTEITVSRGEGAGRLYYTAHVESFLPVEEIQPLDRGIVVQRQLVASSCGRGEACDSLTSARVGEIVNVRLTIIAPHDLYYVVVEDPLPAGGEAIDLQLATTSLLDPAIELYRVTDDSSGWGWYRWSWWWRWYSHSELRDEKVVLFADYLPAGTYMYTYSFRATQIGTYHIIPTTAREFYFPEVFGRGAGELFRVTGP